MRRTTMPFSKRIQDMFDKDREGFRALFGKVAYNVPETQNTLDSMNKEMTIEPSKINTQAELDEARELLEVNMKGLTKMLASAEEEEGRPGYKEPQVVAETDRQQREMVGLRDKAQKLLRDLKREEQRITSEERQRAKRMPKYDIEQLSSIESWSPVITNPASYIKARETIVGHLSNLGEMRRKYSDGDAARKINAQIERLKGLDKRLEDQIRFKRGLAEKAEQRVVAEETARETRREAERLARIQPLQQKEKPKPAALRSEAELVSAGRAEMEKHHLGGRLAGVSPAFLKMQEQLKEQQVASKQALSALDVAEKNVQNKLVKTQIKAARLSLEKAVGEYKSGVWFGGAFKHKDRDDQQLFLGALPDMAKKFQQKTKKGDRELMMLGGLIALQKQLEGEKYYFGKKSSLKDKVDAQVKEKLQTLTKRIKGGATEVANQAITQFKTMMETSTPKTFYKGESKGFQALNMAGKTMKEDYFKRLHEIAKDLTKTAPKADPKQSKKQ